MFIAIIGTRLSGKKTLKRHLINQYDFTEVQLRKSRSLVEQVDVDSPLVPIISTCDIAAQQHSIQATGIRPKISTIIPKEFDTSENLLDFVTKNWEQNFVTTDLNTYNLVNMFVKRPFFLLVNVDAPLLQRFSRANSLGWCPNDLYGFAQENDDLIFGSEKASSNENNLSAASLRSMNHLVNVHIVNSFVPLEAFYNHLNELDLPSPTRLRPDWDTYFMTLASLASHRSNCMKRRVGAVIVRERRIVSTGYNGTPRFLRNCNEGGCNPCNGISAKADKGQCICLHAEENALSEAGRERIGASAVLYCNTCPCEKCTIKIIQSGIKEVVYNLEYKVDQLSARLFKEAGVVLRRHAPPSV